MLAKRYRLPIQSVLGKNGRVVKTPFFLVKVFQSSLPHGRVGVVVSKKVAANATKRNLLRRIVFSSVASFLDRLKGKDILLIMSTRAKDLNRVELRSHVEELFAKIK